MNLINPWRFFTYVCMYVKLLLTGLLIIKKNPFLKNFLTWKYYFLNYTTYFFEFSKYVWISQIIKNFILFLTSRSWTKSLVLSVTATYHSFILRHLFALEYVLKVIAIIKIYYRLNILFVMCVHLSYCRHYACVKVNNRKNSVLKRNSSKDINRYAASSKWTTVIT